MLCLIIDTCMLLLRAIGICTEYRPCTGVKRAQGIASFARQSIIIFKSSKDRACSGRSYQKKSKEEVFLDYAAEELAASEATEVKPMTEPAESVVVPMTRVWVMPLGVLPSVIGRV